MLLTYKKENYINFWESECYAYLYIHSVYCIHYSISLSLSLNYTQVQKIMENFHYGNPQPIIFYVVWDEAKQSCSCAKYMSMAAHTSSMWGSGRRGNRQRPQTPLVWSSPTPWTWSPVKINYKTSSLNSLVAHARSFTLRTGVSESANSLAWLFTLFTNVCSPPEAMAGQMHTIYLIWDTPTEQTDMLSQQHVTDHVILSAPRRWIFRGFP